MPGWPDVHEPGAPRAFFMAKPPSTVLAALQEAIPADELEVLGSSLFYPENWHQSLSSEKYTSEPGVIEMLRRAGARISATAVTIVFSRLSSTGKHRRLQPGGTPEGFRALLDAVENALDERFRSKMRKTPHITISYWSPLRMLPRSIRPVAWTIDEVLLVEGGGNPYHSKELDCWRLSPRHEPQLSLPF